MRCTLLGIQFAYILLLVPVLHAQTGALPTPRDTGTFQPRVKLMSEFFDRFNNTDERFKKLVFELTGEQLDRATSLRLLLDQGVDEELSNRFIRCIQEESDSTLIQFFDDDWFAQVQADVTFNGKAYPLTLTLQIEPDDELRASRWVMVAADADFLSVETRDSTKIINPVSHETRFISLYRIFEDNDSLVNYTSRDFQSENLTALLYAAQLGQLTFEGASRITFQFLQIEGWVFRVARREALPDDWAVVALTEVATEEKDRYRAKNLLFEQ